MPRPTSPRRALLLAALATGRLDTLQLTERTGIPRPGRLLHDLLIERKVRRVGRRAYPKGSPAVVWERA